MRAWSRIVVFSFGFLVLILGYQNCSSYRAQEMSVQGSVTDRNAKQLPPPFEQFPISEEIFAGASNTCQLKNKELWCWGDNENHLIVGLSRVAKRSTPHKIPGLTDVVDFASNGQEACALTGDGSLYCWGRNLSAFGVTAQQLNPIRIDTPLKVIQIEALNHFCFILEDHSVMCAGWKNDFGELGNGSFDNQYSFAKVEGLQRPVHQISVSNLHSCALYKDGKLTCWGSNSADQFGELEIEKTAVAVELPIGDVFVQVFAASNATCALNKDGEVYCWGDGGYGLVTPNYTNSRLPVKSNLPERAVEIGGSPLRVCAVLQSRKVFCWGFNEEYAANFPSAISQNLFARSITRGSWHACSVDLTGSAHCWGRNTNGQLGSDLGALSERPIRVPLVGQPIKIQSGGQHTCALLEDQTVYCWGGNNGRLGNTGFGNLVSPNPLKVSEVSNAIDLRVSKVGGHSCVKTNANRMKCWGTNPYGEVGIDSNREPVATPVEISNLEGVVDFDLSRNSVCAVIESGKIFCWGNNQSGELGNGTKINSTVPLEVTGISTATSIAAGAEHFCAVLEDLTVRCWGRNLFGQLGNNSNVEQLVPVTPEIQNVRRLSSNYSITCAVNTSEQVYCWGGGSLAALLPSGSNFRVPQRVNSMDLLPQATGDIEDLSVGSSSVCVIRSSKIFCWSHNIHGIFGDLFIAAHPIAHHNHLNLDAVEISSSWSSICSLNRDGNAYCWGRNSNGRFGIGVNEFQTQAILANPIP